MCRVFFYLEMGSLMAGFFRKRMKVRANREARCLSLPV
jgi:hypothetical protein